MTEQTLQIKFDKEKLEQIIKSTGISVKLDNKHLTILQELRDCKIVCVRMNDSLNLFL